MLGVPLLVVLAIVIIAAVIAFKVFASAVKVFTTVSAVLFVVGAIAGVVVFKDALDFKNNLQTHSNIMLLSNSDGTRLITGIVFRLPGSQSNASVAAADAGSSGRPLSDAEMETMNAHFITKDYGSMLGSNFKLFIVNEDSITSSLPPVISVEGQDLQKGAIIQQMESGDAESRASAFSLLFALKEKQDQSFIVTGLRDGSVIIYPETPALKAIKAVPEWLLSQVAQKIKL